MGLLLHAAWGCCALAHSPSPTSCLWVLSVSSRAEDRSSLLPFLEHSPLENSTFGERQGQPCLSAPREVLSSIPAAGREAQMMLWEPH